MRTRAKMLTWGGIAIYVATMVVMGRLGYPKNVWTPDSDQDYVRGLLIACGGLSGALVVIGLSLLLREEGPTGETMLGLMKLAVGDIFVAASIALFMTILCRYAYLFMTDW